MGRATHLVALGVLGALPRSPETPPVLFVDATSEAGIHWTHEPGAVGQRYIVETFGGGVLVLDYDADGLPDLYFINGGSLPGYSGPAPENALYRNRGDGTFKDVTRDAGLLARGYGMGGAAADVDNDGDVDLYLTAFGPDLFYRNNGDGTFTETAARAGLGDTRWSTGAALFDADGDGALDLYVANYLDFTLAKHKRCFSPTTGSESYCHPREYAGVSDLFYRNRGDGSFEDASVASGVSRQSENGKGLGVLATDYDGDGDLDIYVANDTTRNFLFRNDGDGRFTEVGLEAGVAYNEEGLSEAGMGVDSGDVDRDGLFDLVVTNFDFERNTLYRNLGRGFFLDETSALGLGDRSLTELGFGCALADFDNDGWLDLIVTNGHILDNIAELQTNLRYAEPGQFFRNVGGRFQDLSGAVGPALRRGRVGRGLGTLDYDADGDLDLVLANNRGPAELLRNDGGASGGWLLLELIGVEANRNAIGARVEAEVDRSRIVKEVKAGSSYLSQNELTVHVGMGKASQARISIRWSSGRLDVLGQLGANKRLVVKEGIGIVAELSQ